jgi:hypothetical protein
MSRSDAGDACDAGARLIQRGSWNAYVGFEDRKLLLGHRAGHVTTHYSAPEIEALIHASEKVCELRARKSHAMAIVRARAESQVIDFMVVREAP